MQNRKAKKMEVNKIISGRILRIRQDVINRKGSFVSNPNPFERDAALWRAKKEGFSVVQIRAALLLELVKKARIAIYPGWNLAGEHLPLDFGFGEKKYSSRTTIGLRGITSDQVKEIKGCVDQWLTRGSYPYYAVGNVSLENNLGKGNWGYGDVYWASGWIENHSIRDYAKVLKIGFGGIRKEIEELISRADISDSDYPQRENFWKAALAVCGAGIMLGRRYAERAGKMAQKSTNPKEVNRLKQMASLCSLVPAGGATTLHEAVQSLWLAHILTCGEDGINANSIGRLDQILFPYYQADLAAGRITREQAIELMAELACKLYLEYDVQAITLGGLDKNGNDTTNEMSFIILEATRSLDLIRDISVRLNNVSSPEFINLCARLVSRGGGIPFFFNDNAFIKALTDRGITREDACGYAPIGCVELTLPGKTNPHAVSGWFDSTKCLELALFDGRDPRSNQPVGPNTGLFTEISNYDEFLESYCRQVEFFARRMVYHCNRGELAQRERGPLPCWSVLTDDCLKRGRDITDGGAVYNYHSVCFLGTANTADSLMVIKKLVFEEKKITAAELLAALKNNFKGREPLRQLLLHGVPKYGNDVAEVDGIAAWVARHFITLMDQFRSPLGGRYFAHLFSFRCNLDFGKGLGATPDGRFAGEPIAYSLSAHQGRDEKGVTALLNSLAHMPHNGAAGGSAAIIDLDPKLVEGETGINRLAQIIQAAVKMGVGQLQFNVVTAERLKLAQECPEKYGNIPVRVAGYSQMFRLIDREMQDHIIARTKHKG